MTDVRVGIVSWNTADLLEGCLTALPAALGELEYEVVVVDNASTDGSERVPPRFPWARSIRNAENVGYAKAMNQALAGGDAPVFIALNPDTAPGPGSLAALVDDLRRDPTVGLVAPRLTNLDGSLQHSVYRFPSLSVAAAVCLLPTSFHGGAIGRRFWLEGHAPHDRSGDVDWAIGAVHCVRRDALAGRPPYRERWFMYVEDLDLCWRLHADGWRVTFDASVSIPHVGNAAGAQAWGDDRTARWLDPTYDWYALEHGTARARLWAAVNVAGLAVKLVFATLGSLLPLRGRARRRAWAAQLRTWLGMHGRKLTGGARAPLPGGGR